LLGASDRYRYCELKDSPGLTTSDPAIASIQLPADLLRHPFFAELRDPAHSGGGGGGGDSDGIVDGTSGDADVALPWKRPPGVTEVPSGVVDGDVAVDLTNIDNGALFPAS
jgi:hypothetical protein